jgi:hypothetical protein
LLPVPKDYNIQNVLNIPNTIYIPKAAKSGNTLYWLTSSIILFYILSAYIQSKVLYNLVSDYLYTWIASFATDNTKEYYINYYSSSIYIASQQPVLVRRFPTSIYILIINIYIELYTAYNIK